MVLDSVKVILLIAHYRFRSLQTPANMIVTSLSLAGMMIVFKLPIFLVNMSLGGPHTALWGAQVSRN